MKKNINKHMFTLNYLLLFVIVSCSTAGDIDVTNGEPMDSYTHRENADLIETTVVKTYRVSAKNMRINGLCFIEENGVRDACEDIELVLVDNRSNEVLESKTNGAGVFTFNPKDRNVKEIKVKSRIYRLKASQIQVSAGTSVTIILVRK